MDRLSSVRGLRRDTIATLGALSSLLGTARGHLLSVTEQTRALIDLQNEPVPGVAHIPALASGLAKSLRSWSASIDTGPSRMHLRDTRVRLNGLTRIRMFFQFLATITSIQISRDRSGQLTAFVGELRAVSRQIETELAEVQISLDEFDRSFDSILTVARSGADHLEPAAQRLTEILAPIVQAETAMGERRRRITAQAGQLSARIEAVIGSLVGTFQFSDSAAQRLEHVETILERGGAEDAFGLLGAAQLQAMGTDAQEILTVLEDSFHTIEGLGGHFVAELAAQRSEVERLLAVQDRAFVQLKEVMGTVMPTLQGIIERSAGFEGQIDILHARLDKLAGIGQTIGLAGVNSHLEAARAEVGQKELTYIAMSVKETAQLALQTFTETAKSLDGLRASFDTGEFAQLQDGMTRLESNLGTLGAGLEEARNRQAALTQLEEGTRSETAALAGLAVSGRQKTRGLAQTIAEIEALTAAIRAEVTGTPDLGALAQIQHIYTMDREREVHEALAGPSRGPGGAGFAPMPVAAPQDTLDSILF